MSWDASMASILLWPFSIAYLSNEQSVSIAYLSDEREPTKCQLETRSLFALKEPKPDSLRLANPSIAEAAQVG